jgi:ABC-2 type transport system ATP-binding protein
MGLQDIAVAKDLTKYYCDFWGRKRILALDSFNLTITSGEVCGLLGPNGSGKTTYVKLLLGLLFPTSGEVTVLGQPATSSAAKSRIGYLPEETNLHRFMNADETLTFHGRLCGMDRRAIAARSDELLARLDLTAARRRRVREYSKGMARRLGLACALVHDPDFLVLDEPTSGLDPLGARAVKELLLELKGRGVTILLCSHLLSEIESVCDRIAVVQRGRLLKIGPLRELLSQPDMLDILVRLCSPGDEEKFRKALEAAGARVLKTAHPALTLEEFFLQLIGQAQPRPRDPQGAGQ